MLTIFGLKKFYFVPDINDMRCGAHSLLQIVKNKHHLPAMVMCLSSCLKTRERLRW